MVKKTPTMGRQKIAIEKIAKKSHRQVTFSKRRTGLFKKASELCTLCGVEVALIVFSPANKAFSFGHPEVESIIEQFISRNPPPSSGMQQIIKAHRNANVHELNVQLTQILNQLEIETNKGEELDQISKVRQMQCWWEAPICELGLLQLEQLRDAMEELKNNVAKQVNKVLVASTNNSLPFLALNGFGHVGNVEIKPNEINAAYM